MFLRNYGLGRKKLQKTFKKEYRYTSGKGVFHKVPKKYNYIVTKPKKYLLLVF